MSEMKIKKINAYFYMIAADKTYFKNKKIKKKSYGIIT